MKIICKFCDWIHEFPPANLAERDKAHYEAGRHYEHHHAGMLKIIQDFDQRLEDIALLPDPRQEVSR
jgi:hypothetical protein